MLKDYREHQIYKLQSATFFVGSKYEKRMSNLLQEDYQLKRPSYYQAVIDNNMIQALIKKPNKYYFNVWTELTQNKKVIYIDMAGKVLDYMTEVQPYICKVSESEQRVRKYHLESIFFLRINGELFVDKEAYNRYNKYLI